MKKALFILLIAYLVAATSAQAQDVTNVYRFYNPASGEHFFTSSITEVSAPTWTYEGVGFSVLNAQLADTVGIYRCYIVGFEHFISNDPGCEGQRTEGMYGYVYGSPVAGLAAIYRLYNPYNGDHLTSQGASEGLNDGYHLEGFQGSVPPTVYWPPAPWPPGPVSVGNSPWAIRYSPGMPASTGGSSATGWVFGFPIGQSCPAADTTPPNFNVSPCHHVDYVTEAPPFHLSPGQALFISFRIDSSGDANFANNTQTDPGCGTPGAPVEVFAFLEHTGDTALTNLGWRWWSAQPLAFIQGAQSPLSKTYTSVLPLNAANFGCVQGSCTAAQFADTLANLGAIGFTFGGGCAKGHGMFLNSGAANFIVTNFEPQ